MRSIGNKVISAPLVFALLAAAIVGVKLFAVGFHIEWDSVDYLQMAENIKRGNGYHELRREDFIDTTRPPLYPFAIGTGARALSVEVEAFGKILNVLAYGAGVWTACYWLRKLTKSRLALWLGGILILFGPSLISAYSLMADTLFWALLVPGLFFTSKGIDGHKGNLIVGAILLGLATVTRELGVAAVVAGGLAIIVVRNFTGSPRRSWLQSILWSFLFGFVSMLPTLLWRGWIFLSTGDKGQQANLLFYNNAAGSVFYDLMAYAVVFVDWILPLRQLHAVFDFRNAFPVLQSSVFIVITSLCAAVIALVLVFRYSLGFMRWTKEDPNRLLLVLFALTYSVVLLAVMRITWGSLPFVVAPRRLDPLYLPLVLVLVPFLTPIMERFFAAAGNLGRGAVVVPMVLVLCTVIFANQVQPIFYTAQFYPRVAYGRAEISDSEFPKHLAYLTNTDVLYANGPALTRYWMSTYTGVFKPHWHLKRMESGESSYLIWWLVDMPSLTKFDEDKYMAQVRKHAVLEVLYTDDTGIIYRVTGRK